MAFALVFARAGWQVRLYDPDAERLRLAGAELQARCDDLAAFGLLKEDSAAVHARVAAVAALDAAVAQADLVQECAPERVELKRDLFARLDVAAPRAAVLASSSSALPASRFAADLPGRERCLVAHPGNPPYLLRVIEIVPAPFTAPTCVARAASLYRAAGLLPVGVQHEPRASSSIACRARCCARPTAWCATAWRRSRTSTP